MPTAEDVGARGAQTGPTRALTRRRKSVVRSRFSGAGATGDRAKREVYAPRISRIEGGAIPVADRCCGVRCSERAGSVGTAGGKGSAATRYRRDFRGSERRWNIGGPRASAGARLPSALTRAATHPESPADSGRPTPGSSTHSGTRSAAGGSASAALRGAADLRSSRNRDPHTQHRTADCGRHADRSTSNRSLPLADERWCASQRPLRRDVSPQQ